MIFIVLKNIAVALSGIAISIAIVFGMSLIDEQNNKDIVVQETEEDMREENELSVENEEEVVEVKEIIPSEPEIVITSEPEIILENTNMGDLGEQIIDLIVSIPEPKTEEVNVSELNQKARGALVNIICTSTQGGLLQPITGSGVMIDSRGVILTNAHIAQYYLLENYIVDGFLTCTIRTGSPAVNAYRAELLYISPSWVKNNFQKISSSNPKGTGEDDFALLLVTSSINQNKALPSSFPFVSPNTTGNSPKVSQSVLVASYPAGFLGGQTIQKDLHAVSTVTSVEDIFTFGSNTLDLFSIGGNIVAQKGSSGGGVVDFSGNLLGIIVTSSEATQTEDRDLRAITSSHINQSIMKDTGTSLNNYLLGNLFAKSVQFRSVVAPALTSLLEEALNN